MEGANPSRRAFSLIEVTTTLAVISFALIGLIGVLPVALKQSRACVDETRAAQLSRMVISTLESEPFTAARCFSELGETPLDLSTQDDSAPGTEPVLLYASYDVRDQVEIIRDEEKPERSEYQIELRFKPVPVSSSDPAGAKRASVVGIKVRLMPPEKTVLLEGTHLITRLKRGLQVATTAPPTPAPR
jgi:uncharacterized protein (TIGR02598 family)